jgi:hypothetical protein
VQAVIAQESGGQPRVVSKAGAIGLGQLMPATARGLGVTDPYNPEQNIKGTVKYLAQQLKTFGGDKQKALAAYNAGPGAVKKYGGIPPYKETQNYVKAIMARAGKGSAPTTLKQVAQAGVPIARNDIPQLEPTGALKTGENWYTRPDLTSENGLFRADLVKFDLENRLGNLKGGQVLSQNPLQEAYNNREQAMKTSLLPTIAENGMLGNTMQLQQQDKQFTQELGFRQQQLAMQQEQQAYLRQQAEASAMGGGRQNQIESIDSEIEAISKVASNPKLDDLTRKSMLERLRELSKLKDGLFGFGSGSVSDSSQLQFEAGGGASPVGGGQAPPPIPYRSMPSVPHPGKKWNPNRRVWE